MGIFAYKLIGNEKKGPNATNAITPGFEYKSKIRRRIGVLYRSDAWGWAHKWDLDAVRQTNPGTEVVSIIAPDIMGMIRRDGDETMLPPSIYQHDLSGINAIFVPGGPAAHPSQSDRTSHYDSAMRWHERVRHRFESDRITEALDKNIPILAVCGGSWRLGDILGARIVTLPRGNIHQGNMQDVNEARHDVFIRRGTMLRRVIDGKFSVFDQVPEGDVKLKGVNSVHWAKSEFPQTRNTPNPQVPYQPLYAQSALHRDRVTEGFESPNRHFVLGIQWHPEYSPFQSEDANGNIMYALGYAALENQAANIIKKALREYVVRKRLQMAEEK